MVIGICVICKQETSISGGNRMCNTCYQRIQQRKYKHLKSTIWRATHKKEYNEFMKKHYNNNKLKRKFNAPFYNKHILKIQCENCQSKENLEYHHITYQSKPTVQVLCRKCHRFLHRKNSIVIT